MKTEQEIKERIEELKSNMNLGRVFSGKHPDTKIYNKVQALEWVLEDE